MNVLITNTPSIIDGEIIKRAGARWPAIGKKYKSSRDPTRYVPFPFFLAYTAAILRNNGFKVSVIDAVALQMDENEFHIEVNRRKPEIVVMETSTPTINLDLKNAKRIKENNDAYIVLTGPHASVFPEEMLKHDFVDFVAMGEYELTVKELVDNLKEGKPVYGVKGLAFKDGGKVKINERRSLIEPLDQLPYPARDLFPMDSKPDIELYWDGMAGRYHPAIKVQTSRGCPFRCNYCLWTQVIYPGKYRVFSPNRVVDEIEHVIEHHGAKMIYFDDDTFTAKKDHALEICEKIMDRGIKIPWAAMCDAMVTTREMVKAMSEAGCITMMFGLESADPQLLKKIGKSLDPERLKTVLDWCREFGIETHVTNCYGLMGDTPETIRQTLEFTKRLDVDSVQFSVAIPYPGTRFYDEAKKMGWLIAENWGDFDGRALVNYPNLSAERIEELLTKAPEEFMKTKRRDPKWLYATAKRKYKQDRFKGIVKSAFKYANLVLKGEY